MIIRLLPWPLAVALVLACPAMAAAQPLAQKAQVAVAPTAITEDWLLGEWETSAGDIKLAPGASLVATRSADRPYLLDLQIYRRSDGRLEAVSTARQTANRSEYVTWKSDIVVRDDTIFATPREIVGNREWRSYTPANYELRRAGDRLVGWSFSRFWIFDNAQRIEFMR
jgi:hypothetical protein